MATCKVSMIRWDFNEGFWFGSQKISATKVLNKIILTFGSKIDQYYPSRVIHNYVVERGWSGANEHYTQ
jgi:hypothetical protein